MEILGKGRGDKWVGWDLKVIGEGKGKVGLGFIIIIPRYYFLGGVGLGGFSFFSPPFFFGRGHGKDDLVDGGVFFTCFAKLSWVE